MRVKANIAVTLFCIVCLIPFLGMVFTDGASTAANQISARPPVLWNEEGGLNLDFPREITDYVADHFAFRQELITANAMLNRAVFGESTEEKVTAGQDGWLFYRETMDDVLHRDTMSRRQLYGSARCLALMDEYAAARGAKLLFTIAPNKASLYPEYLPKMGTPLPMEGNAESLMPFLRDEGIAYADLFDAFAQEDEVLYFRTDSHWTNRGAALAHDALMRSLGRAEDAMFFARPYVTELTHRGDLYEMLYPAGWELEEDARYEHTFQYVKTPRGPDDQRIETTHPQKTGKLLMFRDSFGNSLYPMMADEFSASLFSRAMPYTMELVDETGSDTVIVELVERNLPWLSERAPILPAPEREAPAFCTPGGAEVTMAITPSGEYDCLTGQIYGGIDDTSRIYIQIGGRVLEASPAGEGGGVPFTAYTEASDAALDDVVLFYCQNGQWCFIEIHMEDIRSA